MKTLFRIYFKVLMLSLIACILWCVLTPVFRADENKEGIQFRNLPENIIDIIVLGSSHAQYSMNPAVIYEESGYYSYVLGSGCQPMAMSLHFLKEGLKTQSPEVVLLDVFTLMPARAICYGDEMYYLAIQQMSGENRFEAAGKVDDKTKVDEYRFDLLMNHNKWKYNSFGKEEEYLTYNETLGYVAQQPSDFEFHHLVPFEKGDTKISFKDSDLAAFNEIIDICEENDIKLILFKAPIDIDQENYDYLQAIWEIAKKRNVEYVDYLAIAEEIGFTLGMDGDSWHNNTWGAQKCSKYIANYLKNNGYVTKHEDNKLYDGLLDSLADNTIQSLMTNNIDVYQLLEYASKYDVNIIVKYQGFNHSSIGQYESELLQSVGIDFDFVTNKYHNYYGFISNGEVVKSSDKPFLMEYQGNQININNEQITINDEVFDNIGELELIFVGKDFDWYWEMPIDYASRFFWRNDCDGWSCTIE